MSRPSAEQVAQRAFDLGLLDERQLMEVWASFGSHNVAVDDFLQTLVRREFMTNYQVERLVKGERTGFFYGDYKVQYLIGTGTFARVFRALHRQTGQVVALKVLRKRFSENPVQASMFIREGQVGCTLRHPNIVPIYEVVSEKHTHFLVMEFVEGRSLREFMKVRKKLDSAEALPLMTGITRGLRYACERGLTHRDLRMSNVLISSRGEAKLVDFGLAALDETLNEDAATDLPNARTIDYAALERVSGVRKDDTRSDIYFLGCIFYHMVTGRAPLAETQERIQRLSKNRFLEIVPIQKLDPAIPSVITFVVNKAMTLDPNRRYQTPAAVLADLEMAAKRLAEGPHATAACGELQAAEDNGQHQPASVAAASPCQHRYSVMVVESNAEMQTVFRQGFKRAGYRMLLTSDPQRALTLFRQDVATADCLVINARDLGESALEVFNQFADDNQTLTVPTVLLLDENQRDWQQKAATSDRRIVLCLPITMKQLHTELARLIELGTGG